MEATSYGSLVEVYRGNLWEAEFVGVGGCIRYAERRDFVCRHFTLRQHRRGNRRISKQRRRSVRT